MPYFSFSLKKNFIEKNCFLSSKSQKLELNKVYFSKNTNLWKFLNKKKNFQFLNFYRFEERKKIQAIGNNILLCLPPSIGLGDAVEYGLAFKSIINSKKFKKIAIAFTGRYAEIFKKYFECKIIYNDIIEETELKKFDTIYHLTLEIDDLKFQQYIRSDIEKKITKIFYSKKIRKQKINKKIKIKKITIFPISRSPIRSMSVEMINAIIQNFCKDYKINIVLDNSSLISKYIEKNILGKGYKTIHPKSLKNLCKIIKYTDFGVFMDSGPLHLAKIFGIRGLLIPTSVGGNVLLNEFNTIKTFNNIYKSSYCKSPCGLTDIFNYNNNIGCYQSLSVAKERLSRNNFNLLNRRNIDNKYLHYVINPVGCIKNIDLLYLIRIMKETLDK